MTWIAYQKLTTNNTPDAIFRVDLTFSIRTIFPQFVIKVTELISIQIPWNLKSTIFQVLHEALSWRQAVPEALYKFRFKNTPTSGKFSSKK